VAAPSRGWAPVSTSDGPNWADTFGDSASSYDTVIPFFAYWGVVMARRAEVRHGERLLDVGCGTGASLIPGSSVAGWATGIDASLEMLEHVPWPVPLVAADAAALPLRPASYDVLIAGFLLQFVADATAACREFCRVLRPGGRALVAIPDPQMPGAGEVQQAWGQRLGLPRPESPSRTWVEDALHAAGFAHVESGADEHTFTFGSGEEYVRWLWSHGGRSLLSRIPADQLGEFEAEMAAVAESNRDGDVIPMPTTARFWIGTTPS